MRCKFSGLYIYRYDKKLAIPVHSHAYTELVYYEDGIGITQINGKDYTYGPRSFSITLPGIKMNETHHSYTVPWCLCLYINSDLNFLTNGVFLDTKDTKIFSLLKQIRYEYSSKLYRYYESIHSLSELILVEIERIQNIDSDQKHLFKEVINTIESRYYEDIDLEELASSINYSYDHFRHLFKNAYGMSPKEYIISRRIDHAKQLLEFGSYKLSHISSLCGFTNDSHFSKIFKKYTTMTPTEYKKAIESR